MTAQSGIEFLTGSSTLSAIVKKYSRGLGEHYNTLNWQYLEGISEDKLRILSEIEAADNAVPILNAYIYRKFKFHPDNRPRKITGLFSSDTPAGMPRYSEMASISTSDANLPTTPKNPATPD